MKKLLYIFVLALLIGCTSNTSDAEELRELARKHTIEKLELPEGTIFNYDAMEVITSEETEEQNNHYIVKVTVHSQAPSGQFTDHIYTLIYIKSDKKSSKEDGFELISFE